MLIMTRDFDPLNEASLYQSEFGEGMLCYDISDSACIVYSLLLGVNSLFLR